VDLILVFVILLRKKNGRILVRLPSIRVSFKKVCSLKIAKLKITLRFNNENSFPWLSNSIGNLIVAIISRKNEIITSKTNKKEKG
jgi:hypothetical protein